MKTSAFLTCLIFFIFLMPLLSNACINKYGCAPGYQCVKAQYQMEGVCVKIGDDEYSNSGGGAVGGLLQGIIKGLEDSQKIKRQWREQELHNQQMKLMEEQRKLLEDQRRALEEERQTSGKSCADDCRDMYYAKELKQGISIKECIRRVCN